ncbi:polyprenyl synthetase family protein [Nocardiopsis sp. HNM0947]|uniref:Polyprenyl synthetase family protein n=1 Tax=Nocardiopsis coralli TaxID=2772213 RepID=A0ABR9PBE1_9ACTN|nr:family 2 encapsulin nanocompartment cargo protein polyprenyl transferase [Nocardiopsis coralli]MBE3001168.1 polyprenyl synthetase family protein [Nocardiopsis coralli]
MSVTEDTAHDRGTDAVLARNRALFEPALRAAVDSLSPAVRPVAAYHFGWVDQDGNPSHADSGKAIRPTLALLSAEAVGAPPASAVPAAVAVELVHNFSLLHDDVMDGDTTRRHRPTAWTVFGSNTAILAGDALLTLALDVLAASRGEAAQDGLRMLSAAVLDLINGQRADLDFEERRDVGLEECVRMAEGKTSALLGCACAIGAAYGGGGERVEALREFGSSFGTAFQHVDDLLGIWGRPETTGKPVHSDLRSRKKTLPVVAALRSGTPAGNELADLYLGERELSDAEVARAADLVETAGGRRWSAEQADTLLDRALGALRSGDLAPRPVEELGALARFAVHRTH